MGGFVSLSARLSLTLPRSHSYDEIVGKLTPFLKGTGYNLKTDVSWIPVSGFTGANLKLDVDKAVAPWVE